MMDRNTAKVDEALRVLKSPERRRVLEHLDDESDGSTTVAELASQIACSESRDGQTFEARLHHVHLPKLEDYGVLEYDSRSNAIRYRPDAHTEKLLACLRTEV
jgi:DNA-binding transcriptional ArsR family regulator